MFESPIRYILCILLAKLKTKIPEIDYADAAVINRIDILFQIDSNQRNDRDLDEWESMSPDLGEVGLIINETDLSF